MHAATAETTTQVHVPDVQKKNVLYIPLAQHLLNHKSYVNTWGYKDSYFLWHGSPYGFKLQYMGPMLPRKSDNLPGLHVNS